MGRTDDELRAAVPDFVHQHLDDLLQQLGGAGNKTRVIGALVYFANKALVRKALNAYDDEIARRAS